MTLFFKRNWELVCLFPKFNWIRSNSPLLSFLGRLLDDTVNHGYKALAQVHNPEVTSLFSSQYDSHLSMSDCNCSEHSALALNRHYWIFRNHQIYLEYCSTLLWIDHNLCSRKRGKVPEYCFCPTLITK